MLEWTKNPRGSISLEVDGSTAFVFPFCSEEGKRVYRWHTDDGHVYTGSGVCPTEDEACEAAIKAMGA